MKKFFIGFLVLLLIFSSAFYWGASFFADNLIKSKIAFSLGEEISSQEVESLSNQEMEKIASNIPFKEKMNLTVMVAKNLKKEDINKLIKVASDPLRDSKDIINEAKKYLDDFSQEDLAKIKEIYEKYVKSASVQP
ncbi:MAG: hypothetical protein GX138_07465 [Firmicutes bacterium]|jgi:DNA-directed RNA polymerase alpha subunit|nr:hypothetical protein [Bacillota bacterium]